MKRTSLRLEGLLKRERTPSDAGTDMALQSHCAHARPRGKACRPRVDCRALLLPRHARGPLRAQPAMVEAKVAPNTLKATGTCTCSPSPGPQRPELWEPHPPRCQRPMILLVHSCRGLVVLMDHKASRAAQKYWDAHCVNCTDCRSDAESLDRFDSLGSRAVSGTASDSGGVCTHGSSQLRTRN